MNRVAKVLFIVIVSFLAYSLAFMQFSSMMLLIDKLVHYRLLSYMITYFTIGVPIFAGTYFINNRGKFFANMGLHGNVLKAAVFALLFALPMFLGGLLRYQVPASVSIPNLIASTLFAGFFEELYFRGFLFGQVYRNTRLGFIPAIILGAILFASLHMHQSEAPTELVGIFMTTFMGAVFFAWLFVEWGYNLWVPIALHTFMNLSWYLFSDSYNALGSLYANIFRVATIAIAIILTILYKRRQGLPLTINKETIWIKKAKNDLA